MTVLNSNPFSANKAELTQVSTVGAYKRHASTYELGRKNKWFVQTRTLDYKL